MNNSVFEDPKISRVYLRLALPLVLSMVVSMIYYMADTFFVARTNDVNIVAGVSLCAPLFTTFMALGNIMAQGGSSLISRLLGGGDRESIRRVSAFCFYVTIATGVVLAVILMVLRRSVLQLLGTDPQTFEHASAYYTYIIIGAPVIMLSFIHSNLLRAEGMSRLSMVGTMTGTLLNIALDPLFIFTLGFGAAGAALATVVGYVVTDVFFIIIVHKKSRILSLELKAAWIPADFLKQIFAVGIPAAIVNIMTSLSTVFINQFLLPYGDDKIAAMGIATKVSTIIQLVLTGLTFGGQPVFGYLFGAKDRERLRRLLKFCVAFISIVAVVLTGIIVAAAPGLMRIFMDDANVITAGILMLRWRVISMLFVGIIMLTMILFQAFGKGSGALILSVSRQGVIFLAVLFTARAVLGYSGIVASQAISDLITAAIAIFLFFKMLWKEFRI